VSAVLCVGLPHVAFAQSEPRCSVAGGYVFLQEWSAGDLETPRFPAGWLGTAAYRLGSGRWSAVGEFGVSSARTSSDETRQLMGAFGGARLAVYSRKRLTLFAQALAGLERFSEPGLVESGIAVQPGGGLDVRLSSRVFLRGQGDYRWSQPNGATFHAYRVIAMIGIALK